MGSSGINESTFFFFFFFFFYLCRIFIFYCKMFRVTRVCTFLCRLDIKKIILGLSRHGLKFFSLFVPSGCPLALVPLLVLIEFISYLARNVSLGLRLAANILSGHMLLNILSGFTYNIMNSGIVFFFLGLFPLAFIIAFSGLEL